MVGIDPADEGSPDRPVIPDESEMTDDEKTFWEWFHSKLDELKEWFGEIVGSDEDKENERIGQGSGMGGGA
jgi:hypothetical protein